MNLPFADDTYNPFMEILGMVYGIWFITLLKINIPNIFTIFTQ